MIEVYIDGSSKGNPGPGGAGVVIKNAATKELLSAHGMPLGHVTNNQAEFLALKHALSELKREISLTIPSTFSRISSWSSGSFPRTGRPERTWS